MRCLQQQHRGLAKIKEKEVDLEVANVWFGGSEGRLLVSGGPGSGRDHKGVDERTLKLGKSMCLIFTKDE